jgi:hypothetical protein
MLAFVEPWAGYGWGGQRAQAGRGLCAMHAEKVDCRAALRRLAMTGSGACRLRQPLGCGRWRGSGRPGCRGAAVRLATRPAGQGGVLGSCQALANSGGHAGVLGSCQLMVKPVVLQSRSYPRPPVIAGLTRNLNEWPWPWSLRAVRRRGNLGAARQPWVPVSHG